ncbi:hypothetical protein RO21_10290 [[Actinobacillus] muris]|uniref:TonB-dependent siderophore receptor n=1 Tax=Muribacter muris TaxID=67855 RepID=A0A0J5S1G8_9PAST|nr:TonB-dependent siderophore receptor [Muribacter muris]KMK50707.1 hypothetical protein RO21_10290 [[Actinobacillus] muris] [Muribacter muris]
MKKHFFYSNTAIAVMMAISPAFANEAPTQLDEISVIGSVAKVGKVDYITPRSTSVLSAEKLKDQGVHQLDEATRYEAGVNSQQYGADLDSTDWLKIRGFDATVRVDGASIYKGGYFGWNPNIYGLETIEIVKGADSLTYGTAQTGGLINLISKRPTKEPKGEVEFTLGNRNERGIAADVSNAISDNLRFRLVGNYAKRDGETNKTWVENYYFAPSLAWDISDKTHLTVLASLQKDVGVPTTNFFPKYSVLTAGNIPNRTNYGQNDHNYLNRVQSTIGYEFSHQFGEGYTFAQTYRFAHNDSKQFVTSYGYMLDDVMANKSATYANGTARSHTVDNRLTKMWKNDRLTNSLTAGLDYSHHKVDGVYGFASEPQYAFNVYRNNGLPMPQPSVPAYQDKQRQTGIYLQNQFQLDDKLTVNLGVRRDFAKGSANSFGSQTQYNLNHTSYSAGAMYMTDLGFAPYVSYSESFRPISGNDGQNQYKPYEGKQYEVGFKYLPSFVDGTFSVAYFDLSEKNALVNAANDGASTQAVKQTSKGVEIQADLNLTEQLSTTLSYTYMNAKTRSTQDVDTPAQPRHSYAAMVNYAFTDSALTGLKVGAGLRYTGTTSDKLGNAGIKVPARTLVDLMAKYAINDRWEARVNVSNLANKKYVSSCYYACYYGEGRKITANVSYKF